MPTSKRTARPAAKDNGGRVGPATFVGAVRRSPPAAATLANAKAAAAPRAGLALFLVAALVVAPARAAGGPPMVTDDPGTPEHGHWEINVAALSDRVAGATTYQLPLVDANYGADDRIQLKFEMPWLLRHEDGVGGGDSSGAGDGLAGVKWRFYDVGDDDWKISTFPQVEFGVPLFGSGKRDLTEGGTSYLVPFEFAREFDGFDVNFDFGRWFRPARRGDSWIAGLVFTRKVAKGFELAAELHDEKAVAQSNDELVLNFGTRWDLSARYTLLLAAGRDLRNSLGSPSSLLTYVGLQMRY
jgi:hypothetical protein